MTLLAPAALWLAIVGLAVVALYLLKIKRRRQTVPALDFWQELVGSSRVRSLFQQLKRWLSLALWLVIVVCLILAVGNPILSWGKIKPRSILIIIDNSASMQTIERESERRTRLDLARDVVHELTTRRPVRDEWMLIEACREPRVLQTWTYDRKSVRDAVDALAPRSGSADLAAARELANQLLDGQERPSAVIISDGAAGQVEALWKDDESAIYWPVGASDDNLGITRLAVRPHRHQMRHYAYLSVVNASAQDVTTQLVFELDDATAAVEPATIPAGGVWEKTVALDAPDGGVLRVWIDRPDNLALDNEAFAIAAPIESTSALLVATPEEAFFFEQALSAMAPLIAPQLCGTVSVDEFDRRPPDRRDFDLVIFNNCRPKTLPNAGRFVFVNEWPEDVPARTVGQLTQPELLLAQRDHPLVRHLSIGAVRLTRAREVDLTRRATVLARTTEGAPLIFLCEQPDRQMLCLAFDVLESDLPFRNAFPMLLRNAVVHMVLEQDAWVRAQYRIGETIEPLRPLPETVQRVAADRPRAATAAAQPVPVRNGSFLFPDTDTAGPLRFSIGDEVAYTAVNLSDVQESRNAPVAAPRDPAERLALTDRLFGTVPWLALAIAATLFVCIEWLTFNYRWTE
jgi:hypothetical protein